MTKGYSSPEIPEILQDYYDAQAAYAHGVMASRSLEKLLQDMPEVKSAPVDDHTELLYVDMPAIEDGDSSEAVVLSLPHANGWKPHMYLRARYLQEAAAPEKRLIVLPNNTLGDRAYTLDDEELERVESGDLRPIAEQQARLILQLGIGRVSLMGYSLGAMDAAVLAKVLKDDAELVTIGVFEAPNVMERSDKELRKGFTAPGLGGLARAVKESQIPALSEAMKKRKVAWDILKFGLATEKWSPFADPANKALLGAMQKDRLFRDLRPALNAQPEVGLVLAAAEHSLITPPEQLYFHYEQTKNDHNNGDMLAVSGYGHEMGDNIVVHALLGKASLSRAKK